MTAGHQADSLCKTFANIPGNPALFFRGLKGVQASERKREERKSYPYFLQLCPTLYSEVPEETLLMPKVSQSLMKRLLWTLCSPALLPSLKSPSTTRTSCRLSTELGVFSLALPTLSCPSPFPKVKKPLICHSHCDCLNNSFLQFLLFPSLMEMKSAYCKVTAWQIFMYVYICVNTTLRKI